MIKIDLQNRNAIVCGASNGIGKAIAQLLSSCGAQILMLARNETSLISACKELNTEYGQLHDYIVADFNNPLELQQKLKSKIENKVFDILVNNTGGPPAGSAHEAKIEDYLLAFNQHLIANQILAQAVIPSMKQNKYGRIINIISTSVKQPLDNLGVSNTIRGAVANWSKTLANELGPFNITVNNVLPGATLTTRLESIIKKDAEKKHKSEEEISEMMKLSIPLHRFAEPMEIAYAVLFLSSHLGSYINGINLPVDGGRTKSL